MNRFFTADTHFGNAGIIKYCKRYFCLDEFDINHLEHLHNSGNDIVGYNIPQYSVDEMDNVLFENINSTVGKGDLLYILGDFAFAKTFNILKEFRDRINCPNVHLILGNHDRFPETKYRKLFDSVEKIKEMHISGQRITLSHYPLASWNGAFNGAICLHGHCHGRIEQWKKECLPGLPLIDTGVDLYDYKPIMLEDVIEISNDIKKTYNHDKSHPEYQFKD